MVRQPSVGQILKELEDLSRFSSKTPRTLPLSSSYYYTADYCTFTHGNFQREHRVRLKDFIVVLVVPLCTLVKPRETAVLVDRWHIYYSINTVL